MTLSRQDTATIPVPGASTDDAFLGGKLHCLQPVKGFRAGIDAVFLAAVVPARPGQTTLEAGSGTGIASLCLVAGVKNLNIVGIDFNSESVELARRNALRNGFEDQSQFVVGDLSKSLTDLEKNGIVENLYDHVFANPPYFAEKEAQASPDAGKAKANMMGGEGLDKWLKFLTAVVKPRGTITIIHRAEALYSLTQAFDGRAGGLKIFPLFPKADMPASRVIVQGVKGSRAQMTLLPGQVMHEADGSFTPFAQAILRDGERLKI